MSFEINHDEQLGIYVINIVSDKNKEAEKIKKKILEQLDLEEIVSVKTVEIQVIAKPSLKRYIEKRFINRDISI